MKKSIKLLTAGLLLTLFAGVASCTENGSSTERYTLSTPSFIGLESYYHEDGKTDYSLIWSEVKGATSYEVTLTCIGCYTYEDESGSSVSLGENYTFSVPSIRWAEQTGMTFYELDGKEKVFHFNSSDVLRLDDLEVGFVYTAEVTAVGENGRSKPKSELVFAEYITEGLQFSKVEDGYAVHKGKTPLEGRFALPDYYEDGCVTEIAERGFCTTVYSAGAPGSIPTPAFKQIRLPRHVQRIGNFAFDKDVNLEVDDGAFYQLQTLGKKAFNQNGKITEINAPFLKEVGEYAFSECSQLKTVNTPALTRIGDKAFYGCERLAKLSIFKYPEVVGEDAFGGTTWYSERADGFIVFGEILYKYKKTTDELVEITEFPEEVKEMSASAFAEIQTIERVRIPNGFKKISTRAFYNCKNLKTVVIPNTVEKIDKGAFMHCEKLDNVSLPNAKEILSGHSIFESCKSLQRIEIPSLLEKIPARTFADCTSLAEVELPSDSNLSEIGASAFAFCSSLTEIVVFDGMEEIAFGTYSETAIERLDVPATVKRIGDDAFSWCENLKEVNFSSDCALEELGMFVFGGCPQLKELVLPKSVKKVGPNIGDCSSFSIYCEASTPPSECNEFWTTYYDEETGEQKNHEVYLYREDEPEEEGNFWHYNSEGEIEIWE